MRVLAGYSPGLGSLLDGSSEPTTKHEVLSYGTNPCADVQWDPACSSYQELMSLLPAGWTPDVAIFGSIEYVPVPQGIEFAECLTVGIVGDWNLGAQAYHLMGGAFDALIADRNGCERLLAAGFPNALYTPIWGFDPSLHRRMPDVERDLDIVMVGNLNPNIQPSRTPWLDRVARLSDRYRVCITGGIFGEEYALLQNRARIVFNRSIRGELNMRVHEAAACGALVFYERENREIRELFRDREECVLYGADDLEDLLAYYLEHEDERSAIAHAGWLRVQTESDPHHIERMLDTIDARRESILTRSNRRFLALPQPEKHYCRAYQWCSASNTEVLPHAEGELAQARSERIDPPEIWNALSCATAERVARFPEGAPALPGYQRALRQAKMACQLRTNYVTAHFNSAFLQVTLDDPAAMATLERTIELLDADFLEPAQLRGPYFPRRYDHPLVMELEKVWADHAPESDAWVSAMRDLLLWRCLEQASDLARYAGDMRRSANFARRAVALRPGIGTTRFRLGIALHALKEWREAETQYRLALHDAAFNTELWEQLAEVLLETGQYGECRQFLSERQTILNGCPHMEYWSAALAAKAARIPPGASDQTVHRTRLLAHFNWDDDRALTELLGKWSAEFRPQDPAMLVLLIESQSASSVVERMERFVSEQLGCTFDDLADMTVIPYDEDALAEALKVANADMVIRSTASRPHHLTGLPLIPLAQLKRSTVMSPRWLKF